MRQVYDSRINIRRVLTALLGLSLLQPLSGMSAGLTLASAPLANSTTTSVLPNLMFILDDSGSMGWDYLPDWANGATTALFNNAAYNAVYYNPAITYSPPAFFNSNGSLNTTTYPSQTGQSTATGADSTTKPNWKAVKNDAYGIQSTSTTNLQGNASYYTFIPGEYCTLPDLKTCVTQSSSSSTYPYSGALRWCNSSALTTCQRTRTSTYSFVRYAGQVITPASGATATVTVTNAASTVVSSIKVNNLEILSASTSGSNNVNTVGNRIVSAINNCTNNVTGNCQIAGYSANNNNGVVTITAPASLGAITYLSALTYTGGTITRTAFSGYTSAVTVPGSNMLTNIVSTTNSYPYPGSGTKATTRTDCAGTTCTYAEEMTNYANWWTYYHTRMQAMKTSVSRAFKNIDNRFRVGFSTISYSGATDSTNFQHIDTFELAQKNAWFTKLFAADPSPGSTTHYTPLRGALSKAGQIFAHKLSGAADPVQYSCQQNFTILSTDGYWNTSDETASYGPYGLTGANVGNLDGGTTPRPMYEGPTAVSNSLADVAKYYYDTDLRTSALGNCTGALGAGIDVCANNVFVTSTDNNTQQHMTTFTIGLGVDGILDYSNDYYTIKKDTPPTYYPAPTTGSIDYYNLINGYGSPTVNWPNPNTTSSSTSVVERIDDLWHAAVNGRGLYFSARDPDSIVSGFQQALSAIESKIGAGAAAATSTLNPVAGDNMAYVASYTTVKWKGNLEARSINTATGVVSESATWCAEDVVANTCSAPGSVVAETSGSSTIYYCVTPNSTAATCAGTLVGTDCKVEVATACTGTMAAKVAASTDTRTIYMKVGSSLQAFTYSNLSTAGLNSYFDSAYLSSRLSQWAFLTSAQQTLAAGSNLVNFLRGQYGYEDRASNTDKLFRYREAVLGDATESKPAYIAKPTFSYTDAGYSTFVANQTGRAGTIYIGTNDGMLHAFNASNGSERWAFVPTAVIPNLWKLADKNYSIMHANYVNGSPVISDICIANCTDAASASWKTILVGGLNGGGRAYFALDITNPTAPALLWEFTPSNDADLGYTFGNPVVTKKADGTWVVVFASGYNNGTVSADGTTNNTTPGNGQGYLYVLNANTGALISKYGTGVGSASTPSGLSKIATWADQAITNNSAGYTYGGDLQGNVWRFDINSPAATGTNPFRLATLFSDAGGTTAQPITTQPILGTIGGKRVIFIGTGKYLETTDLTSTQLQTLYAIQDDNATATLSNPRTSLVQQTLTNAGATRTASSSTVDWATGRGWFINFPDSGERQNVDGKLESGTLLIPTTVPSNTVCSPGGYGWLNFLNYQSGTAVDTSSNLAGTKTNAPIVGLNIYYINGLPVVSFVAADHPTPELNSNVRFRTQAASFQQKKAIWRELIQ